MRTATPLPGGACRRTSKKPTVPSCSACRPRAAGREKGDFQINVRDDFLTISCRDQEATPTGRRYTRREAQGQGFEREFALNGKVLLENIEAHYANGVLTVRLPKNPEAMQSAQDIPVQ